MSDSAAVLEQARDTHPPVLTGLPLEAMQQALFQHCAQLSPLAPTYTRHQLQALADGQDSALNDLARCCQYYAKQHAKGLSDVDILARLARSKRLRGAAELIAKALTNVAALVIDDEHTDGIKKPKQTQAAGAEHRLQLPYPLQHAPRPAPPSLMRALLHWPDNDALFAKVVATLAQQPSLSRALCRYATAYTPQGKLLALKPSLLLLGPQRSRELVLLAHFESALVQPNFPLKQSLLLRKRVIQHMLDLLTARFSMVLPVRSELLAYLLIYDAWRTPAWTVATRWQVNRSVPLYRVDHWLKVKQPPQHRVAKRLCQYWHLPTQLPLLLSLKAANTQHNALVALSVAAVTILDSGDSIHALNADHSGTSDRLTTLWRSLSPSDSEAKGLEAYSVLCQEAASRAEYRCPLPTAMRP